VRVGETSDRTDQEIRIATLVSDEFDMMQRMAGKFISQDFDFLLGALPLLLLWFPQCRSCDFQACSMKGLAVEFHLYGPIICGLSAHPRFKHEIDERMSRMNGEPVEKESLHR
jgi:hypothetical protein